MIQNTTSIKSIRTRPKRHWSLKVFYLFLGFVLSFPRFTLRQDLKYYGISMSEMSSLGIIISLPWAIKFIFGMIADRYSICGYHKKPYMIINSFLGVIATSVLSLGSKNLSFSVYITLYLLVNFNISWIDVMFDSLLIILSQDEELKEKGKLKNLTDRWRSVGTGIGAVSSSIAWGELGSAGVYLIITSVFFLPITSSIVIKEVKRNEEYSKPIESIPLDSNGSDPPVLIKLENKKQPKDIFYKNDLELTPSKEPITCMKNLYLIIEGLSHPVLKALLFFNIVTSLLPSPSTPTFFFVNEEVHLSTFDFALIELISQFAMLIGTIMYDKLFRKRSIWHIYSWVLLIGALAEYVPYILTKPVQLTPTEKCGTDNLDWKFNSTPTTCYLYQHWEINPVFLLISDDTVADIVDRLKNMPLTILVQALCKENVEASTYSFFHSTQNAVSMLHYAIDSFAMLYWDLDYGKYKNLPDFILFCAGLDTISVLFVFLLPNKSIMQILKEAKEQEQLENDIIIQINPLTGERITPITSYEKLYEKTNQIIELSKLEQSQKKSNVQQELKKNYNKKIYTLDQEEHQDEYII